MGTCNCGKRIVVAPEPPAAPDPGRRKTLDEAFDDAGETCRCTDGPAPSAPPEEPVEVLRLRDRIALAEERAESWHKRAGWYAADYQRLSTESGNYYAALRKAQTEADTLRESLRLAREERDRARRGGVPCKARAANLGAGTPQDCDWPHCDCDPHAARVLDALTEEGYLSPGEAAALRAECDKALCDAIREGTPEAAIAYAKARTSTTEYDRMQAQRVAMEAQNAGELFPQFVDMVMKLERQTYAYGNTLAELREERTNFAGLTNQCDRWRSDAAALRARCTRLTEALRRVRPWLRDVRWAATTMTLHEAERTIDAALAEEAQP